MLLTSAGMDEDEDSHLCLKCNLTIIGLDNYVLHRRSKCGAGPAFPSIFEPSPRITEDRPRTDDPCSPSKALDFFSSLNLRSNRLEDFLDFDLPIQKNSLDMPSSSTSKHNDMRFPDIELDSNFEPIVDLMKNRKNHFDGLDLEHDNLISDANIANDNKFGRSILDSDIFSIPNENLYVMDQHLNLPMDQALRLSQRPPSQPISEKPMMYKPQESHFFCRTCNRRLATRVSHEKHLRSELHFKRLAENSAYNMEVMVSPIPPQHSRNRRRRQLPHKLLEYNTSVKKYRPRVTKAS
ncbi:hypothetical protein B566_EDAN001035 [Ephemera danica]|nr:hypothetical protein B566_EDAN001035 [Ephemera danica]